MTDHERIERLLRERGQELDDASWLSAEAADELRDTLRAEARREAMHVRPGTGSRLRTVAAIAATVLVALFLGLWMRAGGAPEISWRLYDVGGRPLGSVERGAPLELLELDSLLIELTLPDDTAEVEFSLVGTNDAGVRLALDGGAPLTFPAGGGSRTWNVTLPEELGPRFRVAVEFDGARVLEREISRANR